MRVSIVTFVTCIVNLLVHLSLSYYMYPGIFLNKYFYNSCEAKTSLTLRY